MRPEDKDRILMIAKKYISGDDLDRFAMELDRLEEERDLTVVELADRIAELIAEYAVYKLRPGDREIERLLRIVVKQGTKMALKATIVPKIREVLAYSSIQRVPDRRW